MLGIVCGKGTLAPRTRLAEPRWTQWPEGLVYLHTK